MTKKDDKPKAVRTNAAAMKDMKLLAQQLFDEYPIEHKARHIRQPSTRVALDCLRCIAAMVGKYKMGRQTAANNLYLAIHGDFESSQVE